MTKFYKAPHPVQVDGVYFEAGKPFAWEAREVEVDGKKTKTEPGKDWEAVKASDLPAIEASTNPVPDDANLEAASKAALEAVAIMKHVNIAGLDKSGLIDAIKAAYEPKL